MAYIDRKHKITIVVYGAPKSGTSIIAGNIAAMLANSGMDILVEDADCITVEESMHYAVGKLGNIRDTAAVFIKTTKDR